MSEERVPTSILEQKRIEVGLVQDTNCAASVIAMVVNSLSITGRRYPFTGHEIRAYMGSRTTRPAILRTLPKLAEEQNIYDVEVEERYAINTPLSEIMMDSLRQNRLVQLFVRGNDWQGYVLGEAPTEEDTDHTILVHGFSRRPSGVSFDIQDPLGGSIQTEYEKLRQVLIKSLPGGKFTPENLDDWKPQDHAFIWGRRLAIK